LAITKALILRAVFRLALRRTEKLIGFILVLLGLDLAVPDHSTLIWTTLERQRLSALSQHSRVPSPLLCFPDELQPQERRSATSKLGRGSMLERSR